MAKLFTEEEVRQIVRAELAKDPLAAAKLEALKKSTMRGGPAQVTGGCACWRGQLCDFHNNLYHGE